MCCQDQLCAVSLFLKDVLLHVAGAANTGGDEKGGWTGMRTVAQLRRELGVGAPRDSDSLYKPIERGPRKFNPLKIPKSLQVNTLNLLST